MKKKDEYVEQLCKQSLAQKSNFIKFFKEHITNLLPFEDKEALALAAKEIAEQIFPMVQELNKGYFQSLYTEEQLEVMADFYEKNSWYLPLQMEMATKISIETQKRGQPIVEKILTAYLGK